MRRYNANYEKVFSKTKDKRPLLQNSGVVCKVPYLGCPNVYVGEASQPLKKRISQHGYDVKIRSNSTALASHTLDTGHSFDFENTAIIGRERHNKKRKILEVINTGVVY